MKTFSFFSKLLYGEVRILKQRESLQKTQHGKNCVVVSEEKWDSIKETAYLSSILGLVDSVLEESKAPRSDFVEDDKIEW